MEAVGFDNAMKYMLKKHYDGDRKKLDEAIKVSDDDMLKYLLADRTKAQVKKEIKDTWETYSAFRSYLSSKEPVKKAKKKTTKGKK